MLHFVRGDIFKSQAQIITNPVNCVGVMGKGLALAFKNAYPRSFDEYRKLCTAGALRVGVPCLSSADTRAILLFPTKDHWRNPSRLEYVDDGLKYLAEHYQEMGIESLALLKKLKKSKNGIQQLHQSVGCLSRYMMICQMIWFAKTLL